MAIDYLGLPALFAGRPSPLLASKAMAVQCLRVSPHEQLSNVLRAFYDPVFVMIPQCPQTVSDGADRPDLAAVSAGSDVEDDSNAPAPDKTRRPSSPD